MESISLFKNNHKYIKILDFFLFSIFKGVLFWIYYWFIKSVLDQNFQKSFLKSLVEVGSWILFFKYCWDITPNNKEEMKKIFNKDSNKLSKIITISTFFIMVLIFGEFTALI